MANMSYCRFENTVNALQDCYEHLADDDSELNEYELAAKKRLIRLCIDIAQEFDMENDD